MYFCSKIPNLTFAHNIPGKFVLCGCLLLGCMFSSLAADNPVTDAAQPEKFLQLALVNKTHILSLEEARHVKRKRGEKGLNDSFKKIEKNNIDEMGKIRFQHELVGAGRYSNCDNVDYVSIVIEDDIIPEIIVEALYSESSKIRQTALDFLRYFRRSDLEKHSSRIVAAMEKFPDIRYWEYAYFNYRDKPRLFFQLRKDVPRPEEIFQQVSSQSLLNAKLGDSYGKQRLIGMLKIETDSQNKATLIRYIGNIGDKECIVALLQAFNDNSFYYRGIALRYELLKAIWRNYPDDEFIRSYCAKIFCSQGDMAIGGKDGVRKFYKKLEKWAKDKFGINLNLDNAEPFIYDFDKSIQYDGVSSSQVLGLIETLKKETDPKKRARAVRDLGDRGHYYKECIIALLQAFNDNRPYKEGIALRYELLKAIERNYPNDEFIKSYCAKIFSPQGDKAIGGKDGVRKFYKEMEKWAKDKLGIDLNLDTAEPFIYEPDKAIMDDTVSPNQLRGN